MNGLTIALLLSLLANAGLVWNNLELRDSLSTRSAALQNAVDAGKTCSDSVDALQLTASDRAKKAKVDRARAAASAATLEQRADETLATPAALAGNDCKSAELRIDTWLKGRK